MHRYFLELNYDGKPFSGWQLQDNGPSVQQNINEALSTVLSTEIKCLGCGRTDSGVHALQFYAHFDTGKVIADMRTLKHNLNGLLPNEIAIVEVTKQDEKAHVRFDATWRTYHYVISKGKNAFLKKYAHKVFVPLDVEAMNSASALLLKNKDFAAFCKKGSDVKTTLCDVRTAKWTENKRMYVFEISANRFLRGMVRAITGTLLKVVEGDLSLVQFEEVMNSLDRQNASAALPTQGLFLSGVTYPYIAEHEPFKFFIR